MTGFEHYRGELAGIDHQIVHYLAVCGVGPDDTAALAACLRGERHGAADEQVRTMLHGLLVLRLKVETKMLQDGLRPPELAPGVVLHALAVALPDAGR